MHPWRDTSPKDHLSGGSITRILVLIAAFAILLLAPIQQTAAQADQVLYLTVDDGPDPSLTGQLLDLLDSYDAKMTYFPVGWRVNQHPTFTASIAARGHAIGNHSFSHAELSNLTDEEIHNEFITASDAIEDAAGYRPACMRPPHGTNSPRVNSIGQELGMPPVFWNLGGGDYGLESAQQFFDSVAGASSGDIILLHDVAGQNNVDAAALVLDHFTERGFEFEVVPACEVPETATLTPGGEGLREPGSGTTTVDVPLRLNRPLNSDVTVSYETQDRDQPSFAESGADYVATSGVLTIPAGHTEGFVRITVLSDSVVEPPLLWGEWGLVRFFDPSPNVDLDLGFFGLGVFVIADDE